MTDSSTLIHKIMPGEKALKVGRSNEPLRLFAETKKKNPNSLRFLFGHIINFYYEGDRSEAAEQMQPFGIYISDRPGVSETKTMRAQSLNKILHDKDHIEYWHIEAFAKATKIPACGLLTLSLAYSMVRKGQYEAVKKLADGLRALANRLDVMAETHEISKTMMLGIRDGFKQSQPELFEKNHSKQANP